jgi:hypothetical protein
VSDRGWSSSLNPATGVDETAAYPTGIEWFTSPEGAREKGTTMTSGFGSPRLVPPPQEEAGDEFFNPYPENATAGTQRKLELV